MIKEWFYSKIRNKTSCSLFHLLVNNVVRFLGRKIRKEKEKDIQLGKKEVKVSLSPDDKTLYTENPKDKNNIQK